MAKRTGAKTAPDETALALVDRLYAAALEPDRWPSALHALNRYAGAIAADLFIHSASGEPFVAWTGISDELMEEYLAHYHADNRRVLAAAALPAGKMLTDLDLYTPEEIKREAYYQDLLFAHGYGYFTGTSLIAGETEQAYYGVHYAAGADAYDEENLRRLRLMAPHVQRAAELQARLGATASRERELREAFDAFAVGALLLDGKGRVASANAAAHALACRNYGLVLEGGTLRALRADQDQRLRMLLRTALDGETLAARGGHLLIRGPQGSALTLLVAPLPTFRRRVESLSAVVLLGDGRFRGTELARAALCEGYGLTRSEAALALGLAEGRTIAEYARHAGLTVGTARTVSKRVMAKLGVHRQSELVTLLVMQFGFVGAPRDDDEREAR